MTHLILLLALLLVGCPKPKLPEARTVTLPMKEGEPGQVLKADPNGNLTWENQHLTDAERAKVWRLCYEKLMAESTWEMDIRWAEICKHRNCSTDKGKPRILTNGKTWSQEYADRAKRYDHRDEAEKKLLEYVDTLCSKYGVKHPCMVTTGDGDDMTIEGTYTLEPNTFILQTDPR